MIGPDVPGRLDALARVRRTFEELEQRFSRFRPDSELSDVNRRAGRWTVVSDEFARLLACALDGARRSGGLFDPTVLAALVAAGYDRDFNEVTPRVGPGGFSTPSVDTPGRPIGRWSEVRLVNNRLLLPEGVALDFGAVGKGWAADRASESIQGLPWAVVDAGGDLRIVGSPPDGGLDIAVEDPVAIGAEVVRLKLSHGALATSSVTRRSWGPRLHHIIDPRTGRPAITRVLQATAWGETCADAEIRATWALLAGPGILNQLPAILFLESGEALLNLEGLPQARP